MNKFCIIHSDCKNFTACILLFVISIILAFNSYNADYEMYEYIYGTYANSLSNGRNVLFEVICRGCNLLSFDYQTFVTLIITICLFGIYRYIRKYSNSTVFILILYVIGSAILDGIQIRQFIATVIYLNVLPCLIQENSKKGTIIYIVGTLVATGFHSSFLFFLILLLLKVEKKRRIKIAVAITIVMLGAIVFLQQSGALLTVLSNFMADGKIQLYFVDTTYHNTTSMVVSYVIEQPLLLVFLLMFYKKFGIVSNENEAYINSVIGINILMLCISPVYFYSLQFRRMLRVIFVPSFIALEKMIPERLLINRFFYVVGIIGFALISFYWNVISNQDLLNNLLLNNYLFR